MTTLDDDLKHAIHLWEARLASEGAYSDDPFEIEPAPLDAWLTDKHFVNLGFTPGPEQMMALRHIEWVLLPATWDALGWFNPVVRLIHLLILKWGKGGGKDMISQVGLLRVCYLLQCLRAPQAYYGIGLNSTIHLLNTAVSGGQANTVFYQPLKSLVTNSPFFKDRSHAGLNTITFDKQIELISGHSETKSQEGMNLLVGVADEIAEFKTKEELEKQSNSGMGREPKQSAEAIDKMLRTSGRSRFPEVFKAIYLSWTRFKGDYIEKLYSEGEKDIRDRGAESEWHISHKATWEANPSKTRADFDADYRSDPVDAAAKYECKPPAAREGFFKNLVALARAFPERAVSPVTFDYVNGPDPDNPAQFGWQAVFDFDPAFKPERGRSYAVHIDLAHTGDKAGWAMSHVSGYRSKERTSDEERIIRQEEVTLDLALAFPQGSHGEIELRWCRQLVFRLREQGWRIVYVTLDGYQSTDTIQILNSTLATRNPHAAAEEKRVAENYSLDRSTEGYDTLKSCVYAGLYNGYRLPKTEDGTECIWWRELKALERRGGVSTHAKIDHPPYGSKDVTDAIAGSCRGAIHASRVWGAGGAADDDLWVGGASEGPAPDSMGLAPVGSFGLDAMPDWGSASFDELG